MMNEQELVEKIKADRRRWKNDPVAFVQELFQIEPTVQQKKLLMGVVTPGAKVSVRSGHGTGKTTSLAWLVFWFLTCFKNARIPCTAPSQAQLRDVLWAELSNQQQRMPKWWQEQFDITSDRVMLRGNEKTSFAVARTASKEKPDALQGFHADNLLFLVDEAPGVDNKVFQVASGALSTEGSRVVMCGNPTQTTGYFFESHNRNRDLWNCLRFSCLDSPLAGSDYADGMAKEYGKDSDVYRVRVLGDFPLASINQLISEKLLDEALKKTLRPEQISFAPKILGVDVAPYGDDRSAIFYRQGLYSELLYSCNGIDDIQFAGKIVEIIKDKGIDGVFVDRGAGSGVLSALSHLGYGHITTGVSFGGIPGKVKYLNKRAEMWGDTLDWLVEGGVICGNEKADAIKDDLKGPQYFYNMSSKLQLERKEDMKKRGLASPDLGDALALTFAYPVASKAEKESHYGGEVETGNMDYDPFS